MPCCTVFSFDMKKIFFFLLFALSALSLRAQLLENDTAFYAYGFVDNLASTLDNEYILNVTDFVGGLLPYANTTFEETDIDTGFIVWHNCQRFKITEVSSTSPLVLQVYDLGENRPLIEGTSGRIMILKEKPGGLPQGISTTGDGPGVTTGVAPDYYACILSFYLRRLAGITSTSGGDVTGPLDRKAHV